MTYYVPDAVLSTEKPGRTSEDQVLPGGAPLQGLRDKTRGPPTALHALNRPTKDKIRAVAQIPFKLMFDLHAMERSDIKCAVQSV